jgi:hypothetical protein
MAAALARRYPRNQWVWSLNTFAVTTAQQSSAVVQRSTWCTVRHSGAFRDLWNNTGWAAFAASRAMNKKFGIVPQYRPPVMRHKVSVDRFGRKHEGLLMLAAKF